ncbi:MAG: AEC family transporter [Chloroflexi bacterium]|nr:AEC family transporter [Chloroflexota bacterium]
MPLLNVFVNNLLPILLLSGAGFALGRALKLDSRPLGRVIFYILSPVLIFNLLTGSKLAVESIVLMMGYSASVMLIIAGIALLLGKLLRLERSMLTVVVLTSLFANNGNYGLPLISFAFGQEALAYASIYFVTNSLLLYTVGVVIASLGHLRLKEALLGLLKVPAIYAIILAVIFIRTGWVLPAPIQMTVELTAGGAVPAMLILLGLELQKVEWTNNLRALSIPVVCRLLIGAVIGLVMAAVFGLNSTARKVGITQAGMPSAVMTTILANEYKLDSSLVTAIVFISTILSPLTLTPLLYFLGK